jgi:hypothetical protein
MYLDFSLISIGLLQVAEKIMAVSRLCISLETFRKIGWFFWPSTMTFGAYDREYSVEVYSALSIEFRSLYVQVLPMTVEQRFDARSSRRYSFSPQKTDRHWGTQRPVPNATWCRYWLLLRGGIVKSVPRTVAISDLFCIHHRNTTD